MQLAPPDAILGTALAYKADKSADKVNLGIGAYRDDNGKPYPFNIVKKVEKLMIDQKLDKEYLPIDGNQSFVTAARKLILGADAEVIKTNSVASS